jgi:hypothetical protein
MEIDRKKKAVMVAIAYYLEKEAAEKGNNVVNQAWSEYARKRLMLDSQNIQRKGRTMPFSTSRFFHS